MRKVIFLLGVLFVSLVHCQDIKKIFDEYDVKGSFVMYDLSDNRFTYFDSSRCSKQFIPASTFKIPNSIIGLETGIIKDENFIIPWDSVIRQVEAWNHDMDLKNAIRVSCVPYYQELARRVGVEKMQEMINKLKYGNMDLSGGIDKFWLTGGLRISQTEQIDFLVKLYRGELAASERSMDITKKIMQLEDTLGYILRAKTGRGDQGSLSIGWFVGWLEKAGNVYFFATNIESENPRENFARARKEITMKILKELGVI